MTKQHFKRPVYCKENVWIAGIYPDFLALAHIMQNFERKCLSFVKLHNTPKQNALLNNFAKYSNSRYFIMDWHRLSYIYKNCKFATMVKTIQKLQQFKR